MGRSATDLAVLAVAAAALACGRIDVPAKGAPAPLPPVLGCAPRAPVAALPAGPVELWAAPDGRGEACLPGAPCDLPTALARLRPLTGAMTGDVRVVLRGGTYALTAPLELCEDGDAHDSGTNGFRVILEAAPGERPVLSGGRALGPWVPAPARPGVWVADAPGLRTRQLFVNGVRALRARAAAGGGTWSKTSFGFVGGDRALLGLRGLEIGGRRWWRSFRCPVETAPAAGGATALHVSERCWKNVQGRRTESEAPFESVAWIENALALLDEPGEWFLDEGAGKVYYAPRAGEDLATAEVVAPVLETLLRGAGGVARDGTPAFLENVVLRGLEFRHTTWLAPSGPGGYADYQAGFHRVGDAEDLLARTPGAVTLVRVRNVRIEGCTFAHLGGAGLDVAAGPKDVAVVGNVFFDVSSSAIQAGDVSHADGVDDAWRTRGLIVSNNLVRAAAVEYEGGVGMFVGYAEGARIEHNDVSGLPYSGISMGWGWGLDPSAYPRDNLIAGNHVHDVMLLLHDGGAIYTLGPQPGSRVVENHVERSGYVALYHDQGSSEFTTTRNVTDGSWCWLSIWTHSIRDNLVTGNWADDDLAICSGGPAPSAQCNIAGNRVAGNYFGVPFPPLADAVRAAAGLEPAWRGLAVPRD